MGITQRLGTIPLAIQTDASNNVGIGAAPSGSYKLEVTGTAKVAGASASPLLYLTNTTGGTLADFTITENVGLIINSYEGASARSIDLKVAGVSALTIASTGVASFTNSIKYTGTGNILDASSGNTSYLYQYLVNTGGGLYFGIERNTGGGLFTNSSAYATVLGSTTATSLQFATNGIVRATITSGGDVLIGQTTNPYSHRFISSGGTLQAISAETTTAGNDCVSMWNKATSGNNIFAAFYVNSSILQVGTIDYNRAGLITRYNTTSDGNLKNIIGNSDKQKSINILNSTKIREYSWKEDETNKPQIGVIAQELYETFKGAVVEGSDSELFGTKEYKNWQVDKTAFTFHLIAGWQKHEQMIQEQQATIQELNERLNKAGL